VPRVGRSAGPSATPRRRGPSRRRASGRSREQPASASASSPLPQSGSDFPSSTEEATTAPRLAIGVDHQRAQRAARGSFPGPTVVQVDDRIRRPDGAPSRHRNGDLPSRRERLGVSLDRNQGRIAVIGDAVRVLGVERGRTRSSVRHRSTPRKARSPSSSGPSELREASSVRSSQRSTRSRSSRSVDRPRRTSASRRGSTRSRFAPSVPQASTRAAR
jgi:hypothetical protein